MSKFITEIINNATNRYLENNEKNKILEYTTSMPERLQAADEIQEKEQEIVQFCINETKKLYPNFHSFHESGWSKGFRDVQLILRGAVNAMLIDDHKYFYKKTLNWHKSLMKTFNLTPKFMEDTYSHLKQGAQRNLSEKSFFYIEPFLTQIVEELSSIPEPATPMV